MWSSEARRLRGLGWAVVVVGALALGGCSGLRPVYSDAGFTNQQVELRYAAPASRLEQVIYQDLALRLGKSQSDTAPLVKIEVSQGSSALTSGTVTRPFDQAEMKVTAKITVTGADGEVLFKGTRSQTADYNTSSQAGASNQAADDAAMRAAKLLADTIHLQILAALAQ